jgi:hypothetical protein
MDWFVLWFALAIISLSGLMILVRHGLCAAGRAAERMLGEADPYMAAFSS